MAVLLLMIKFQSGGDIDILKSCTEVLQQFHRPKKQHKGSPVKAKSLKGPKTSKRDDDPRHEQDRNPIKNRDDMLNKLTNFSFYSESNLANRFSYPKANLNQASQDHDYFKAPFTEY